MGFLTDYKDVQDFGIIPMGEYEVIIEKIEERTTKNGKTGLNIKFTIRNDVEQDCKNRCLFHTIWKRREPTEEDEKVQGYGFNQLMFLAKIAKLPNGKNYETLADLCIDLVGCVIRVTVEHESYNGKSEARTERMTESRFPDCKHTFKGRYATLADTVAPPKDECFADGGLDEYEEILSDDDLPF